MESLQHIGISGSAGLLSSIGLTRSVILVNTLVYGSTRYLYTHTVMGYRQSVVGKETVSLKCCQSSKSMVEDCTFVHCQVYGSRWSQSTTLNARIGKARMEGKDKVGNLTSGKVILGMDRFCTEQFSVAGWFVRFLLIKFLFRNHMKGFDKTVTLDL